MPIYENHRSRMRIIGVLLYKRAKQPGYQEEKIMPRKYLAMPTDKFVFAGITTIYSMINPIEKKLVAAGYNGPLLADFDNAIYKELGVIDNEATQKLQEQSNEEWEAEKKGAPGNAPKVDPVYKKQMTTM